MTPNIQGHFALRMRELKPSAIREIFKVLASPGMLSMAGGMPAPESFPISFISEAIPRLLAKYGTAIFQYGATEGESGLRRAIQHRAVRRGLQCEDRAIHITAGAQGALNAVAMLLLNRGDPIAVESPTFVGALKCFKAFEPEVFSLSMDQHGVDPDAVRKLVRSKKVKFIYLIPNFQNPSGRTLSLERRIAIAEIARTEGVVILEDDPYYELRYRGADLPTLQQLAPEWVIHTGSLSKVLSPGLRLGYCIAPAKVTEQLVSLKQGIDVHSSKLSQFIAADFIGSGALDRHIPTILELYRPRYQAMLDALREHFPNTFRWSEPEGGMFVWVEGPNEFDAQKLYDEAIERGVAFVPGRYFHADESVGRHTIRLNFTNIGSEKIVEGIKVLGEILKGQ